MLIECSVPPKLSRVPKYPVVLCHGFSGFDHMFSLPVFSVTTFANQTQPLTDMFKNLVAGQQNDSTPNEDISDWSNKKGGKNLQNAASMSQMGVDNKGLVDAANSAKYLIEYWNGVMENLSEHGCSVLIAKVPPFAGIETRASALDLFLRKSVPQLRKKHHVPEGEPVKLNLVAHSMGGLDCRYLIFQQLHSLENNKNPPPYKVVSLTTISTPHRGTAAADFAMKYSPPSVITNYFPSIYELTSEHMTKFNNVVENDPSVKYFSYGAQFSPYPGSVFLITWKIVSDKEGPNDGLVSLKSAKWGDYQGYLDDVDHADLINWMGPMKMAKLALGVPNFNPKYFYLQVVDNIAANGL